MFLMGFFKVPISAFDRFFILFYHILTYYRFLILLQNKNNA